MTEAVAGLNSNFVANIIIISKGFPSRHPFFPSQEPTFANFNSTWQRNRIKTSEDFCDFLFKYCIRFSVLKNIARINLTRYFETIFQLLVKTKNCISWFYFSSKRHVKRSNVRFIVTANDLNTKSQSQSIRPFYNLMYKNQQIIFHILQSHMFLRSQTSGYEHLSSATSFPNFQTFPSQITIFETSSKRPPLATTQVLELNV